MTKAFIAALLAACCSLFTPIAIAQDAATGTLVVEIKPYRSERELPKKITKQRESGALEWGIRDNQLVFTSVNRRFVDFPVSHMTRFGQSETLQLPAGEYKITGIGIEMTAGFNIQKILDRGAYVNEDMLSFNVEAGKTTTLVIDPVFYKDSAFIVDFWVPTMMASIKETDAEGADAKPLNKRVDQSIAWPQYNGPLKFKSP